jgi:5-hydroxyisourate hydrolase
MSGISTHILDTSKGTPVAAIQVHLWFEDTVVGSGVTDNDGRVRTLLPEGAVLKTGFYRIKFEIGDYFPQGFYPEVSITFAVRDSSVNYHVPLLLSPFGYTTYRGS